jgi:hypothetical protein
MRDRGGRIGRKIETDWLIWVIGVRIADYAPVGNRFVTEPRRKIRTGSRLYCTKANGTGAKL